MSPSRTQIVQVGAAIVALGVGYFSYARLYASPRDAILARLGDDRDAIGRYEAALKQRTAVNKGLKATGARTLRSSASSSRSRPAWAAS